MKFKLFLPLLLLALAGCEEKNEPFEVRKITKSGTVVDCRGGKFNDGKNTEIRISSPIQGVEIKNCELVGSIRIFGLGMNGEAAGVKESSHTAKHTQRAQAAAPSGVLISNLTIRGVDRIPVYLAPGVTKTIIENSEFVGTTDATVIYLDAESARNTIRNNTFNVKGGSTLQPFGVREVIAIDGSAHNTITGNTFERAVGGGVYLYRNCGEGGTVRHQAPQYNSIEKNSFNLTGLSFGNYGIWLGSRNGNRSYCSADKGYSFGSSVDDRDFAYFNTVKDNKFVGSDRTVKDDGLNNSVD